MNFLGGMYFYTPIMTLFLLQRNIELGFLIAAQAAFNVAMMVGELPTGVLADKYGQKFSMRLGIILDAVGMVQLLFVQSNMAVLIFFAVRGFSVALRSGADEALLYETHRKETGTEKGFSKSYGKFLSNDVLGFIVSSVVAGVALQVAGSAAYVPLIVVSGLTSLAALVITYTLRVKIPIIKQSEKFQAIKHIKESVTAVTKNQTILALTVVGLLTLNGEYFLRQTYPPFFEQMAVPAIFLGLALAVGKLLNYFVIRRSYVLEKYLSVDQIVLAINLTLGVAFIGFALAPSIWTLVALFILIQGLLNADKPVISDYINQRVASYQRSTVLSSVSFTLNSGQVVARLALAGSVALIGLDKTYVVQGTYLVIGALIGVWYLRRCGCTHRVKHSVDEPAELELTQELA